MTTKEIYDKYPKTWVIMRDYLKKYIQHDCASIILDARDCYIEIDYLDFDKYFDTEISIPFSMLYGLLENFFQDNGIIITIDYYSNNGMYYRTRLLEKETAMYFGSWREYRIDGNKSKDYAKCQAVLKACEILEKRL